MNRNAATALGGDGEIYTSLLSIVHDPEMFSTKYTNAFNFAQQILSGAAAAAASVAATFSRTQARTMKTTFILRC